MNLDRLPPGLQFSNQVLNKLKDLQSSVLDKGLREIHKLLSINMPAEELAMGMDDFSVSLRTEFIKQVYQQFEGENLNCALRCLKVFTVQFFSDEVEDLVKRSLSSHSQERAPFPAEKV